MIREKAQRRVDMPTSVCCSAILHTYTAHGQQHGRTGMAACFAARLQNQWTTISIGELLDARRRSLVR